jgi:hypothetical protein
MQGDAGLLTEFRFNKIVVGIEHDMASKRRERRKEGGRFWGGGVKSISREAVWNRLLSVR